MTRMIAWLRAVNVGGNRRLPMEDLRLAVLAVGATSVSTYIQSGNVVFTAENLPDLATRLDRSILELAGVETSVVLRTASELASAIAAYPWPAAQEDHRHIVFYAEAPKHLEAHHADKWLPEQFSRIGNDMHLLLPLGMGKTKMSALFAVRKGLPTGTARNWRTCLKMLEMATPDSRSPDPLSLPID